MLAPTHSKILFSISYFLKLFINPHNEITAITNWKKLGNGQPNDTDIKQRNEQILIRSNANISTFILRIIVFLILFVIKIKLQNLRMPHIILKYNLQTLLFCRLRGII